MPHLIVDGYNLLLRAGRGADEAAREQLVRDAQLYARQSGRQVVLVFDSRVGGGSRTVAAAGVSVMYARGEADAAIVELVRRSRRPRAIAVLTADRALADAVTALGATVDPSSELRAKPPRRRRVAAPKVPGKPSHVSAREVEEWLLEFDRPPPDDDW